MNQTPHLVAHYMAAGAGQRLGDYHFLRNTYETISGQEVQLNRILRMLDEDEIALNWRIDTTPISRARSRFLYDFDRPGDSIVLPGNIAYERLREWEREDLKKQAASTSSSTRPAKLRATRPPPSDESDAGASSAARLRAIAEYDAALAEAEAKRKQKALEDDLARQVQLNSFTVRYEGPTNREPLGSLLCEWALPRSSSQIDYFTIERQIDGKDWSSVGEKIDKTVNQTALDLASFFSDNRDQPVSSARFRLKAHLNNRSTVTSEPTDEVIIDTSNQQGIIIPRVEVLSSSSVQLTWDDDQAQKQSNLYDIEKRAGAQMAWEKVLQVPLEQGAARLDQLTDAEHCQFRLVPSVSSPGSDMEPDVLTVHNVNEWLSSLCLVPTSSNTVDIDISEDGFKEFDQYKVEYTTIDGSDQWTQMPDIVHDNPHLTIVNLKAGGDYKFRFTPVPVGTSNIHEGNASQLSLVLDVKMPSTKKAKLVKNEAKIFVPPPQFAIHQIDPTSVFIEAIVPTDKPVTFEDTFDIYSKKDNTDDQWTKIGTIDKEHLSLTIKNLEENTAYVFKIDNRISPSADDQNNILQEFKFETASVKQYDPSLFLEKIEQSLENVVNNVMRAAAGHQTLEDPVNISLNQVIREIFHDESLVPNEQYGFDTLALSNDLQLFRGPKQILLQDLDENETSDTSKVYGEILIHSYRRAQPEREQQPVIVREENGNTRIGNIDGDVIVRNVVTDVLLTNEETRNQLSMNIVGQAFLKGVQGVLIASNFKGIIVVKTVHKP